MKIFQLFLDIDICDIIHVNMYTYPYLDIFMYMYLYIHTVFCKNTI